MNELVEWNWQKLKKYTGIYRCPDDIINLIIRVQIRELENDPQKGETKTTELESKTFRWQEKAYGKFEREFYKDEKNCVTDLDKEYHRNVLRLTEDDSILYSYVDEDEFCIEEDLLKSTASRQQLSKVRRPERKEEESINDYVFIKSLYDAIEYPHFHEDFQRMFLMVDFGEYVDDTWVKSEHVLCALKYSKARNVLLIYPDFTTYEPHDFQINSDLTRRCVYSIENMSNNGNTEVHAEESKILNKVALCQLKQRERAVGFNFTQPPTSILIVHLFCEILTGKNFEYDDIYVQYFIDLPDCWRCADQNHLKGLTYSSHTKGENNCAHFGFPFELTLECDLQANALQLPYIYFEVISKDTWNRHRTVGLAYKVLPARQPGIHRYELQCLRLLPKKLHVNMKRFFIGDYMNYDDITWLAVSKDHEGSVISKFGVGTIGTGQIDIKMGVVHHSQMFAVDDRGEPETRETRIFQKLSSSALVRSVEEVLAAFKKARKNMMEAKKKV